MESLSFWGRSILCPLISLYQLSDLSYPILIFARLKLSRYRDPQLQVGKKYSYLFNLRANILKQIKQIISNFHPLEVGENDTRIYDKIR